MTSPGTAPSVPAATDLPAIRDLLSARTWPCQRVLADQTVAAVSRVGSVMLHPEAVTDPTLHTSVTEESIPGGVGCESVATADVAPRFRPRVNQFARHGFGR